MQLEHSFTVPVGVEDAWQVLLDIERIAPCMPGAAIDSVDGDNFTGTVKVKLGPIGLTYKGKASFVEKDETTHRVAINAQGRDARGNGTAAARVTATLTQEGEQTKVDVLTDLDITGKPAQFGRGVMVDVGNKLIGQFAECLAGKLSGGGAEEAAAPTEPAAEAATAAAEPAEPTPAPATKTATKKPPAKETAAKKPPAKKTASKTVATEKAAPAAETAAPVPTVPAPTPTPRPTAPASAAPPRVQQPAEVEPINLLESAGPAVAKRLVPLIAAIVFVLIVLRLRRR